MRILERHRVFTGRREQERKSHWRLDDAQELERVRCLEAGGHRTVRTRETQCPVDLRDGRQDRRPWEVSVEDGKIGCEIEREFQRGARPFGAGNQRQWCHAAAGLCCSSASIALTASPTVRT